jgi:hypothetical protein
MLKRATLAKLSICKCGFPILAEHIKLGKKHMVDPERRLAGTCFCGGCKRPIPIVGIWTEPGDGYLPEEIFEIEE